MVGQMGKSQRVVKLMADKKSLSSSSSIKLGGSAGAVTKPPIALTIAGHDPSGGAGLLADVKSFSALGCYGMAVMTALTAQNTCGVKAVYQIPTAAVANQLAALLEDSHIAAIKLGMLFNSEIIRTLVQVFENYQVWGRIPLVLDPVMVAKSGDYLLLPAAIEDLVTLLLPKADIITPNLREAEVLLGHKGEAVSDYSDAKMVTMAEALIGLGAKSVLLKGGHLTGASADDYFHQPGPGERGYGEWLRAERITTANTHGTGCSLAAAITAHLALGYDLTHAVKAAKSYIHQAIEAGQNLQVGQGAGPVHHFYNYW